MSILISFILRKESIYSPLFLAQQLPHLVHLIFRSLRLVRPRSSSDIRLDAHYSLLMKHSVCLSDDLVDSVPWSFYTFISACHQAVSNGKEGHTKRSPGRMHGIFQTRLLNETLDVGDLSGYGGTRSSHLSHLVSGLHMYYDGVVVYAYRDQAEIRRAFGWGWDLGGRHVDYLMSDPGGSILLIYPFLSVICICMFCRPVVLI